MAWRRSRSRRGDQGVGRNASDRHLARHRRPGPYRIAGEAALRGGLRAMPNGGELSSLIISVADDELMTRMRNKNISLRS